jgi:hypothetical protein
VDTLRNTRISTARRAELAKSTLLRRFFTPVHFGFLGGSELAHSIDSTEIAARSDIFAGSASSEPTSLEILMSGLNLLMVA